MGFLLGNLDPELRELFSGATKSLIPFFAFALGNTINLGVIIDTGLLGILMALAVIVITGVPLIIMDIMLGKGRGTAGIAASSTAGAAVATPLLVAEIAPDFAEAAPAATTLVASCVVITAIVVPVITALWAKHGASASEQRAERRSRVIMTCERTSHIPHNFSDIMPAAFITAFAYSGIFPQASENEPRKYLLRQQRPDHC